MTDIDLNLSPYLSFDDVQHIITFREDIMTSSLVGLYAPAFTIQLVDQDSYSKSYTFDIQILPVVNLPAPEVEDNEIQ